MMSQKRIEAEWFAELRDVHVARGETVVLHGIDLALRRGEHAVILGPNGCGKSSLIKLLTCECYPLAREGSVVRIFGRERWAVEELRKRLGVVSADLPGPVQRIRRAAMRWCRDSLPARRCGRTWL